MTLNKKTANNRFRYVNGRIYYRILETRGGGNKNLKKQAGYQHKNGIYNVSWYHQVIPRGRLVWIMHTGKIPKGKKVLHKNGKRNDDRIENLELGTASDANFTRKKWGSTGQRYITYTRRTHYNKRLGKEIERNYWLFMIKGKNNKTLAQHYFNKEIYSFDEVIEYRDRWLWEHSPRRYDLRNR